MNRFNNQQKTKTMIQPNEIRCGNLFHHNDNWSYREKGGYFQWSESDWYALGESTLFIENVSPIQLTPEILEKCGFETPFIMKDSVKYLDGVMIDLHNGKILLRDNHMIEIKYLHQLQNLYYALTGKELDISKFIEQQKNILEN